MIRRFKQIKGVGTFVGLEGGSHQFEQLTFIFGENGYGKSTICDVFFSLSTNDFHKILWKWVLDVLELAWIDFCSIQDKANHYYNNWISVYFLVNVSSKISSDIFPIENQNWETA